MKKYIFIITFMLGLFAIYSCKKDEVKAYISENPTVGALQSPAAPNGITFVKADAGKYITFSWPLADFGFQASISYGVQISLTDDFAKPVTVLKSQKLIDSVKVSDFNAGLLSMKLEVEMPATIKCRIFATVGSGTDSAFSAITEYTVTPYETLIDYPMLYVPGDYQGWSPGAVNGRLFSYGFNSDYENILRLNANGFAITPAPNWDNKWGLGTLTPSGDNYSGTLVAGGSDIKPVTAACYVVKFNTSTLAVSFTKTNDWGIIGTSIPPYGWSVDVDMFYNGQRQMWEITGDFKSGEFKFRHNDAWGEDFPSPNLTLSEDGNYTIRMETVNKTYTITKN
jgi:starch-binding outer membrane protein SusE/F